MTEKRRASSALRGVLLVLLGGLVGANATYFLMTRDGPASSQDTVDQGSIPPRNSDTPSQKPLRRVRDVAPGLSWPKVSRRGKPSVNVPAASTSGLLIPVQGIAASQLTDTFTDARSANRLHDAIDIMAPAGTPVLAVADGHVEKLFDSKLGGLTIYHFNNDDTLAYYYGHLQRYADGISEKQSIKRGQLLGYVGSTGNASPDGPHLHFAVFMLGPEKQWWKGDAINPYPLLTGEIEAK